MGWRVAYRAVLYRLNGRYNAIDLLRGFYYVDDANELLPELRGPNSRALTDAARLRLAAPSSAQLDSQFYDHFYNRGLREWEHQQRCWRPETCVD